MNKVNIIKRFLSHQHKKRSELNYIKHNGYISCNDCIYFTDNFKCKRFLKNNNETGNTEYPNIYICRTSIDLCGPTAEFKIINTDRNF